MAGDSPSNPSLGELRLAVGACLAHASPDIRGVAWRLAVDLAPLSDLGVAPSGYGGNIPPEAARRFADQAETVGLVGSPPDPDDDDAQDRWLRNLRRAAEMRADGGSERAHVWPECGSNRLGPPRLAGGIAVGRLVRYLPATAFAQYHMALSPLPAGFPGDPVVRGRIRQAVDRALVGGLGGPGGAASTALHPPASLSPPGQPVWCTSGEPAPHAGLPVGPAAALRVVRRLALPGYRTPEDRLHRMGLVALSYPVTAVPTNGGSGGPCCFRPTALDAIDQAYFHPGPTGGTHGETWPLGDDFAPGDRLAAAGLPEWIHGPCSVQVGAGSVVGELVGFFEEAY